MFIYSAVLLYKFTLAPDLWIIAHIAGLVVFSSMAVSHTWLNKSTNQCFVVGIRIGVSILLHSQQAT